MKWLRKHRPSPGTAFGLAALVIALGGAAFAAIPDSNGTIHGCYQKTNGSLRVVESASECRSSERAVSWSAGSQPGSGVVARATNTGPATSSSPVPFEGGADIPLTGNTWTQRADETDQIFGIVEFTPPAKCLGPGGHPDEEGFMSVSFFIDGKFVGDASSRALIDEQLVIKQEDSYAYEPGSSDSRTLSATAADTCQDGNHFRIDSVKVSVFGMR